MLTHVKCEMQLVKGRSYRTFFQIALFFSQEKQEKQDKQEKQETLPKFGNLTEGKILIPIFGKKKMENVEMQKNCAGKNLEI